MSISKYYDKTLDGETFKVKKCDKNNCGAEIFWDESRRNFIDLIARNSEKNFHWNYCLANNSRMDRSATSGSDQQPYSSLTPPPQGQQQFRAQSQKIDYESRETIQNVISEILIIKSKLLDIEKQQYLVNDESKAILNSISQIVNNWIQNNPVENSMYKFIEMFKEYLPPPTLILADQLKKESMNSDDVNPIPDY